MLRDSIRHLSKKLLSFELAQGFNIQFRASRYMTGLNQTSEKKVIVVWIGSKVQHSISSVSICYGTQTFFFGGRYAPFVGLKWMLLVLDISAAFQGHFFFQSIWTRREKNMITVESWFLCMEKIRLRGGNPPLSAFRSPKVNNWGYSFQSHVYPPIYL